MLRIRLLSRFAVVLTLGCAMVGAPTALADTPAYTGIDFYTMNPANGLLGVTPAYQHPIDAGQAVGFGPSVISNQQTLLHGIYWTVSGTPIDLNPTSAGYMQTVVEGIGGGQQVGYGSGPATGSMPNNQVPYNNHALLWTGTAASAVDLNPTNLSNIPESQGFGSDGLNQVGMGSITVGGVEVANHALLWSGTAGSAVDLHPTLFKGYTYSSAFAVSGNQQVGEVYEGGPSKAILWSGSAASAVNLDPVQLENGLGTSYGSVAYGVGGGQQVGEAAVNGNGTHAMLWTGNAASAVDLNPAGSTIVSIAYATNGSQQVGFVGIYNSNPFSNGYTPHAMVWSGTAASAVDLNGFLPASFGTNDNSSATSVDGAGDVFGIAQDSSGNYHAVEWVAPPHLASAPVSSGTNQKTTVAGRSPTSGQVDVSFQSSSSGTLSNTNSLLTSSALASQTASLNFALPTVGGLVQTWDVSFTGTFTGPAILTFHYDPSDLAPGTDPTQLQIDHFSGGQWVALSGTVDPVAGTITVSTDSFSPFALGAVPEPSLALILVIGIGLLRPRSPDFRKHRRGSLLARL